jgi:hypothetical protein
MGHSEFDPAVRERRPWNAGRMAGSKRALKPQQVWAIRFWLEREGRLRNAGAGLRPESVIGWPTWRSRNRTFNTLRRRSPSAGHYLLAIRRSHGT